MKVWEETWAEIDGVICDASGNAHFRKAIEEAKAEGKDDDAAGEYAWEKIMEEASSRFSWEQGVNYGAFGDMDNSSPFNPKERDVERAKLASCAPEMVRMLIQAREYLKALDSTHKLLIEINNLLKKAGVL